MDPVDDQKTQRCRKISPGASYVGKQELTYSVGVSAETAGAKAIHLQVLEIPPGAMAKAHRHASHETAIFQQSGVSAVWHGERLENHDLVEQGEYFYVPADVPHLPYNPSATETCIAVIARTDPNEQESVELLPDLESNLPPRQSWTHRP